MTPFLGKENLAKFTKETNTFDVIEIIGSGGFGVVVKVINRNIKNQVYAIKRVPLERNMKNNQKILREADLLSRLNHCNVVRYLVDYDVINRKFKFLLKL